MFKLIVCFIGITEFHLSNQHHTMSLDELLKGRNYLKDVRPFASEGVPVSITAQLLILKIYAIDERLLSFKITYILREMWTDKRLARNDSTAAEILYQEPAKNLIWVPNIDIINSDDTKLLKGSQLTLINHKGEIYHSERLVSLCTCHMNLWNFPMDTQTCPFIMEPYAYPAKDINLTWYEIPVQKDEKLLRLTGFSITKIQSVGVIATYSIRGKTTKWNRLEVYFSLKRVVLHVFYRTYLPIILVIVFNIGSYWIPDSALPARCTLIITTFLTSTFILQNVSKQTETSDKSTALQIFITCNIVIIVVAIIEYLVILQLRRKKKLLVLKKTSQPCIENDMKMLDIGKSKIMPKKHPEENDSDSIHRMKIEMEDVHVLDKVFRILIPTVYIIFCCSYFGYYASKR